MDYVGGDQIRRRGVKPGDVLWIGAVEKGHLYLLSRVVVEEILNKKEAQKKTASKQSLARQRSCLGI